MVGIKSLQDKDSNCQLSICNQTNQLLDFVMLFQGLSAAFDFYKFERRDCCLQDKALTLLKDIRSATECLTMCIADKGNCKALTYDSRSQHCFLSASLGSTCSSQGVTYCGKFQNLSIEVNDTERKNWNQY